MKKPFISFLLLLFFSPLYLFANAGSNCFSAEAGGQKAIIIYSSGDTTVTADTTEGTKPDDEITEEDTEGNENADDEIEYEEETRHSFIISAGALSHNQTNMRDDGITEFVASPSLTVRLPLGFSFGYSALLSKGSTYEGSTFNLGYLLNTGKGFYLLAGYSYYQFTGSSGQRKANYTGALDFGCMYLKGDFGFSAGYNLSLGTVSDQSLSIDADYTFTLSPEDAVYYDLTVTPAITIAWGAQDPDLNVLLLKKQLKLTGNTNTKIKKPKFGILGYAFALPFDYSIGNFSITLGADYIIPVNVADSSTRTAYINLSGGVSFRFW